MCSLKIHKNWKIRLTRLARGNAFENANAVVCQSNETAVKIGNHAFLSSQMSSEALLGGQANWGLFKSSLCKLSQVVSSLPGAKIQMYENSNCRIVGKPCASAMDKALLPSKSSRVTLAPQKLKGQSGTARLS